MPWLGDKVYGVELELAPRLASDMHEQPVEFDASANQLREVKRNGLLLRLPPGAHDRIPVDIAVRPL
jgi:hypothetical protein